MLYKDKAKQLMKGYQVMIQLGGKLAAAGTGLSFDKSSESTDIKTKNTGPVSYSLTTSTSYTASFDGFNEFAGGGFVDLNELHEEHKLISWYTLPMRYTLHEFGDMPVIVAEIKQGLSGANDGDIVYDTNKYQVKGGTDIDVSKAPYVATEAGTLTAGDLVVFEGVVYQAKVDKLANVAIVPATHLTLVNVEPTPVDGIEPAKPDALVLTGDILATSVNNYITLKDGAKFNFGDAEIDSLGASYGQDEVSTYTCGLKGSGKLKTMQLVSGFVRAEDVHIGTKVYQLKNDGTVGVLTGTKA